MIWPRSAILHRAAASRVAGMSAFTVSTAARMATRGRATPITWARSMALRTMSAFMARFGAILMAASVMMKGRGYAGVCIRKQWLMRRLVRRPALADSTADISSSVCRLPFIKASTSPLPASSAPRAAAAWLCSTSSMAMPSRLRPASAATASRRARGATSTGVIRPAACASSAPDRLSSSQGWITATLIGPRVRACSSRRRVPSPLCRRTSGKVARLRSICSAGAITCASPSSTTAPCWLTQRQARVTWRLRGSSAVTVTLMARVSPTRTGCKKRRVWPV